MYKSPIRNTKLFEKSLNEKWCRSCLNESESGGGDDSGGEVWGGINPELLKKWYDLSPIKPIVDSIKRPPPCNAECLILRCINNPPCDWKALMKQLGTLDSFGEPYPW